MKKMEIRQVFARNLRAAMEKSDLNQVEVAARAGISQSHVSEILREVTSVTIDLVADIANALGKQPWELLADSEAARQAAMSALLWGHNSIEEPPEVTPRIKKRGSGGEADA